MFSLALFDLSSSLKSDKYYDHTIQQVKASETLINHMYIFYFLITKCTAYMSPRYFVVKHDVNLERSLKYEKFYGLTAMFMKTQDFWCMMSIYTA